MQNPFSLSFGKEPLSLIDRDYQNREILDSFTAENPAYQVCMITGVRGAGKTVALTTIANDLRSRREWIVVDLNPEMDLLHQLAAELSNRRELFELFRDAKINLSFLGFGIEIDGEPPITDIVVALRRMLERICHSGKRVLITVDEASATPRFRAFASQFQIFIRENLNVFLLMTGLYENIAQLQNSKNLTFLYRAPKVDLKPLNALRHGVFALLAAFDLLELQLRFAAVAAGEEKKLLHQMLHPRRLGPDRCDGFVQNLLIILAPAL